MLERGRKLLWFMVVRRDPRQFDVMKSYLERTFLADLIMVSKSRALGNPCPLVSAVTEFSNYGVNKKLPSDGQSSTTFAC